MYTPWFVSASEHETSSVDRRHGVSVGPVDIPSGSVGIRARGNGATVELEADAVHVHAISTDESEWIAPEDRTRQPIMGAMRLRNESDTTGLFGVQLAEPETELLALFISTEGAEVVEWRLEDELVVGSEMVVFTAGDSTGVAELLRLQRDPTSGRTIANQLRGCKGIVLIDHAEISTPLVQANLSDYQRDSGRDANRGRARVWSGIDSEQRTVAVVLDLQPFDQGGETAADPWMRDIHGWGRFSGDADRERLDYNSVVPWVADVLAGSNDQTRAHSLGSVPLAGPLFAGEPTLGDQTDSTDHHFVPLGVDVVPGLYRAHVVYDVKDWPRPGMLLLEIGQGRPTRWTSAPGVRERSNLVVADIGQMTLWCDTTPESLYDLEPVPRPRTGWSGAGGGIVVSGTTYGDGGVHAYVGVDAAGVPVAVVLDSAGLLGVPDDPEDLEDMSRRFSS